MSAPRGPPEATDGGEGGRALPYKGRRDRVATLLSSLAESAGGGSRSICTIATYRRSAIAFAWLTGDDDGIVKCGECRDDVDNPRCVGHVLRSLPQPVAVVVPIKLGDSVQNAVRAFASSGNASSVDISPQADASGCVLSFLSAAEFSVDAAHEILRAMWPERSAGHWASRVDLGQPAVAMALGALLTVLGRRGTPVRDVVAHTLASAVRVSPETLFELQVFRREDHPAAVRGVGSAREGISLYSMLLDRCRTPAGRAVLRQWLLLPTAHLPELQSRLDGVALLAHQANRERLVRLATSLRAVRPVDRIISKIRAGKHRSSDYSTLVQTCKAALAIVGDLRPLAWSRGADGSPIVAFPLAAALCEQLDASSVNDLIQFIQARVDLTAPHTADTAPEVSFRVRSGADQELDEYRAALALLDSHLTQVARTEVESLPRDVTAPLSVVFYQECGYVVHINTSGNARPSPPFAAPPLWTLMFETDGHRYFKTPNTVELDRNLGDVQAAVAEKELAVADAIDQHVLQYDCVLATLHLLNQVDALCALATLASDGGWGRPTFSGPGGAVHIRRCFHPLLSKTTLAAIIPFDFTTGGGGQPRVTVVTGPNGSGKSMMSHAIALVHLLAHIGSFVPCASACVPLVDMIAINDACTVLMSQALVLCPTAVSTNGGGWVADTKAIPGNCAPSRLVHSSYGHDLAVVGRLVRSATRNSLLLLDEFGRGTLASDGAALLAAILQSWIAAGAASPLAIVTTHASEILDPRLVHPQSVQWLSMRVTVTGKVDQMGTTCDGAAVAVADDEIFGAAESVPLATSHLGTALHDSEVCALPAAGTPAAGRREIRGTPANWRSPEAVRGRVSDNLRPMHEHPQHPNLHAQRGTAHVDVGGGSVVPLGAFSAAMDDAVVPLFEPRPATHRQSHSNALSCAALAGLDPAIIDRARVLLLQPSDSIVVE